MATLRSSWHRSRATPRPFRLRQAGERARRRPAGSRGRGALGSADYSGRRQECRGRLFERRRLMRPSRIRKVPVQDRRRHSEHPPIPVALLRPLVWQQQILGELKLQRPFPCREPGRSRRQLDARWHVFLLPGVLWRFREPAFCDRVLVVAVVVEREGGAERARRCRSGSECATWLVAHASHRASSEPAATRRSIHSCDRRDSSRVGRKNHGTALRRDHSGGAAYGTRSVHRRLPPRTRQRRVAAPVRCLLRLGVPGPTGTFC